jgi:DHA2 family multidrug resistance protein
LLILAAGSYWMSQLNLDIAPSQVIWPRVVLIIGLSLIFAPINVAAFLYIPRHLRGAAVGIFALLRNEGGSFGTSLGQTITERREQLHSLRLNESLDPFNPAATAFLDQSAPAYLQQTGDPVAAQQMALQSLDALREHHALALSYFDTFLLSALVAAALAFVVPFMKKSVVAKGTHVSAE